MNWSMLSRNEILDVVPLISVYKSMNLGRSGLLGIMKLAKLIIYCYPDGLVCMMQS